MRRYSKLDSYIGQADRALRTLYGGLPQSARDYPGRSLSSQPLSDLAVRRAGRLMRVNHSGEIAAQALYQGQSLTCKNASLASALTQAASEEADHLRWCQKRLDELDTPRSGLGWLWYLGAFALGAVAGALGDRVNLGFLAETERQVVDHLDKHMAMLPRQDYQSRAILAQMRMDEQAHQLHAEQRGALSLPRPIRLLMRVSSRVMTVGAYWI